MWSKETRLDKMPVIIASSIFLLLTYFFPNETLAFFGLVLSGVIGSRLLIQTSYRAFDLLALSLLVLEMVVGLVPSTFNQITLPALFHENIQVFILVPILLFFFAPNPDHQTQGRSQVDLMHGVLSATLIFVVLLGGIVINQLYSIDYLDGLLLTVFIVSTMAIGISWFWNPEVGYSGMAVLWNRYAMTIGGPFETWINTLTALIEETYLTPADFLEAACDHLVENDWLNAIQWNLDHIRVKSGEKKGFKLKHKLGENIGVMLYFKSNPGKALEHHTLLLIRMAYQFYLAKVNQEKVRSQEHFSTIHHTGARLTHDIKNILQSIKTSLEILNMDKEAGKTQKILQANLSQISFRLENTLDKLRAPMLNTQTHLIDCVHWAKSLARQHQTNPRIKVHADIENNISIPVDLFDSVIDNLIDNTVKKTSASLVEVRLLSNKNIIVLSVCDNGDAIKPAIEKILFTQPVSSGTGMGIGLYQAAIMAQAFNFELELSQNEDQRVCFNLFQHLRTD